MYTSLHVSDTPGLDKKQRELLTDLGDEISVRGMLGNLIQLIQEMHNGSGRRFDFVSRVPHVLEFLRKHGIDFFPGENFSRWDNDRWSVALGSLCDKEHDIDAGLIASAHPDLPFVGKPIVGEEMARRAGTSSDLLPVLRAEVPEFNFGDLTLDARSRVEKVSDFFHITSHAPLTADHPRHVLFVQDRLVPKVKEVVAHSLAAEGNHMAKKWMTISKLQNAPDVRAQMDVFFRQLRGMRADRDKLFHTVHSVEALATPREHAVHPEIDVRGVERVLSSMRYSLLDAWQCTHEAGRE